MIQFQKNLNSAKKCKIKFESSEVDNYFSDLELLKKITPNIKHKYDLSYEYFKAVIFSMVIKNNEESIRLLTNIINDDNLFFNAYFALWKILENISNKKDNGKTKIIYSNYNQAHANTVLLKFSLFIVKNSLNEEVSTSDWVNSFIKYSKALYYNDKFDQAITVLMALLDIFCLFPREDIKFLPIINKNNQISLTNVFENFDKALSFYSKFHIYKKCEEIFNDNYIKKENIGTNLQTYNQFDNRKSEKSNQTNQTNEHYSYNNEDDSRSLEHTLTKSHATIEIIENSVINDENEENDGLKHVDISQNIKIKNISNFVYDPNFGNITNESGSEDELNYQNNTYNNTPDRKESSKLEQNKEVPDLNIRTLHKLEEYLDNNIDVIEVNLEKSNCNTF